MARVHRNGNLQFSVAELQGANFLTLGHSSGFLYFLKIPTKTETDGYFLRGYLHNLSTMYMAEPMNHDARDLEELLDQLDRAADTDHRQITVAAIITAVGPRSFAPLLLLVGVLITSPLRGVSTFPSVIELCRKL